MKDKLDNTEQLIQKEFHNEADSIEKDVETICADEVVTEKITDEIRSNVDKNIDQYEKERIYSLLPEEDKKALEIGRRIQRKKPGKRKKMYLSLAAALVLAMAIGVTSLGGPERVVKLIKQSVGQREVRKTNRGYVKEYKEENEEEAYQKVKDVFGCDIVKIIPCVKGMKFQNSKIDETLQISELYYKLNGELISYYVNASYSATSWGIDVEDKVLNNRTETINGCTLEIKEYSTEKTGTQRYSVEFEYQGLEYFLIGTLNEEELKLILRNLYFF
ncbi:DUF4367 domain-containing protein [[Clostridium] hylemonae]|uniref:DUF4367 domain-containing protein n=1 Tax=[Clostridium] hylemonae DSM 15053 TaxID=553973 RepID=C0C1Z3_9FIRM|nr:DUF4367 domain-containing protein [[Clostridium] hylemonae]EEG74157.1 hypothetical protein CLOHYLEM_06164 [[Clostridium] hylemonae DSM 15053]QEK19532.1 hypothetical protein LAJLEIBI_03565 [[Clostridium] hylemonae DSM 15053]